MRSEVALISRGLAAISAAVPALFVPNAKAGD
jgi:hypothetical protein